MSPSTRQQFMADCGSIKSARPAHVSVVVPLYNKAAFVMRAIDSVLAQSRQPAEVIVVDDGSTDGGAEAVNRISDPRLRLLRQSNGGVSAARNAGIAAARFPLIAFLDADDQWMQHHLETIIQMTERYPACDVFATSYFFQSSQTCHRPAILRRANLQGPDGVLKDYLLTAIHSDPPLFSSAVAVTKQALDQIGGFPIGIAQGEDLITWVRLALNFQIAYSQQPSVLFWNPEFDSASPTRSPEVPDRVGQQLDLMLRETCGRTHRRLRQYLSLWHRMRGTMFLRLGERRSARAELDRSLHYATLNARSILYSLAARSPASLIPTALGIARGLRQLARRPGTTAN